MSAPQLLGGQVAIVTGGAQGIGLAIAEAMLAHGGSVLVADIDGEAAGRGGGAAGGGRCKHRRRSV